LRNNRNSDDYTSDLDLSGSLSANDDSAVSIALEKSDGIDNPSDYFEVYDGPNGLAIRLIRAIDRDVSD
jgi:hypothetical protein